MADSEQFQALSLPEQHFIGSTLAFIAASGRIVAENLCETFATKVELPKAGCFYDIQIASHGKHPQQDPLPPHQHV